MSVTLMAMVWRLEDVSSTDKLVLLALADAAHDDGYTYTPIRSKEAYHRSGEKKLDLLTKCQLSERAIQGSIKRLVENLHLTRKEKPGIGVDYWVHPGGPDPRSTCAPQHVRPAARAPTPAARAPKPLVTVTNTKGGAGAKIRCPDDFWPNPSEGSQTAQRMDHWSATFLAEQVEKFVAHHQTKETRYSNWQQAWTTWALNSFDGKDGNGNGNGNSRGGQQHRTLFEVGLERQAARRTGRATDTALWSSDGAGDTDYSALDAAVPSSGGAGEGRGTGGPANRRLSNEGG